MHTLSGVPGATGGTGVRGAVGPRGHTGVNIIDVKVEAPHHRVPRQVAGCPGMFTLILSTEPENVTKNMFPKAKARPKPQVRRPIRSRLSWEAQ